MLNMAGPIGKLGTKVLVPPMEPLSLRNLCRMIGETILGFVEVIRVGRDGPERIPNEVEGLPGRWIWVVGKGIQHGRVRLDQEETILVSVMFLVDFCGVVARERFDQGTEHFGT